jgi:membrane associated rhomboid family serine protease
MSTRGQRWRWFAADLRAAHLTLGLGVVMVIVHLLVFYPRYPFNEVEVRPRSEWAFMTFGLLFQGLMEGKLWQLFSHGFLHGFVLHLLINVSALLLMGCRVERIGGTRALLKVFTLGVLAGGLLQVMVKPEILLVGASGGVVAILLWLTTVDPHARAWPIPISAKNLGRGILLSEAGFTIASLVMPDSALMQVAHGCHLGGGLAGWWLGKRQFGPVVTREDLLRDRARWEAPREEEPIVPPDSPA